MGRGLLSREADFPGRRNATVVVKMIVPLPQNIFALGLCRCDSAEDLETERFLRIIQWAQCNHKSPGKSKREAEVSIRVMPHGKDLTGHCWL